MAKKKQIELTIEEKLQNALVPKEEQPYKIPNNWCWVRLGNITQIKGGKRIPKGTSLLKENTGYKYIRVTDMKNGTVLNDDIHYISKDIYNKIKTIKGTDWTKEFAEEVYNDVTRHKYFITNLAKCTQVDARPLPDSVYKEYLELFKQEIGIVKPKNIVLFGNQVSSIVLDEKIAVSQVRKKCFTQKVNGKEYKFYSVFYPVGNGRFNIDKSIEDIKWIINQNK